MESELPDKPPFFWDNLGWERRFASNLQAARERLKLSQYELAQRASKRGLKFHQTTLQRIETGRRAVKLSEAALLAELVGESLDSMMRSPTVAAMFRAVLNALDFRGVRDARHSVENSMMYIEAAGSTAQAARGRYEASVKDAGTQPNEKLLLLTTTFIRDCQNHADLLRGAVLSFPEMSSEPDGFAKGEGPWTADLRALWTTLARIERSASGKGRATQKKDLTSGEHPEAP